MDKVIPVATVFFFFYAYTHGQQQPMLLVGNANYLYCELSEPYFS